MARPEPVPPCIHKTPARKIAVRDALYGIVYQRTHERFAEQLLDIRNKNRIAMGYSWDGFTHRGVYYGQDFERIPGPHTVWATPDGKRLTAVQAAEHRAQLHRDQVHRRNQRLDDSLVADMDQLLADREEAEKVEGAMVRSTLGTILNSAQAVSDYKRLLPSLLHPHLDQVATECSCEVPTLSDAQIDAIRAKHQR